MKNIVENIKAKTGEESASEVTRTRNWALWEGTRRGGGWDRRMGDAEQMWITETGAPVGLLEPRVESRSLTSRAADCSATC